MNNIAVFYGKFSPVNLTHLSLTLSIITRLKIKEFCFFLPEDDVPFIVRKGLLRKGIRDYGIQRNGFYFIDGQHKPLYQEILLLQNRKQGKIYLVSGEEKFPQLEKEEQFEKISKLSHLVLLPNREEHLYPKMDYLDIPLTDFDNSLLRNGSDLSTTKCVLYDIADNRLYFCKEVASLMKEHRYLHSVSVAKTAYKIASRNQSSKPYLAFQAGIFHDSGKDLPLEEQKKIVETYFSKFLPCPEFAYHQFVSRYLAKEKFHVKDEDVLNAIMYHCTGKKGMDVLEKIIYAADKDEPTRPFEARKGRLACYQDIQTGFVVTLKEQVAYFKKKNIPYMEHFLSKEMYQEYLGEENNAENK